MTDLTPKARRARENRALEKAGYVCVKDVWIAKNSIGVIMMSANHAAPDVARIKAEAVKPKGERK